MRLSEESIKYILDLQKKMLPLIYCCCCSCERLNTLSKAIAYYNGKVVYKLDANNSNLNQICTLLIFLDEIDIDNILDIEKKLIVSNKKKVVLLEANGINSLIHKRNLAISLINRYNINVIKGSKEEIDSLIKFQYDKEDSKGSTFKYRYFSKKNDSIIIIKDSNYYITDGYSEFQIRNINSNFLDKDYLENIYTAMIANSIGVCNNKCEIIQAILISSMAFCIAEENTLKLIQDEDFYCEKKENIEMLNQEILNSIYKIDVDNIKAYGDIDYCFKR